MLGAVVAAGFFQFAQQILLALGQIDRCFDNHVAHQVTMSVAAYPLDTLAAQTENTPRLGFGRNLDGRSAIQCRDFDFAAKCCGSEGNRHFAMQVVVVTRKYGMLLEVDLHVEIVMT